MAVKDREGTLSQLSTVKGADYFPHVESCSMEHHHMESHPGQIL